MSNGLSIAARLAFEGVGRAAFSLEVAVELPPGITAVLGPSGGGKTTLLGIVAGRVHPREGRVVLGERVLFDSSAGVCLPPVRRRVGYVFQDHLLFPHLTVLENAAFGVRGTPAGGRRERAQEWLARLGVEHLAPRHPGTLSAGERQRVALARALAAEPDAVLLDEPMAALDLATRAELLDAEREAQRSASVPFVHVCHSPAEAARVGDHALVLSAGRIVQEGPPLEVLNAPRSLAVARAAGFENILPARILGHREADGVTEIQVGDSRLEMGLQSLPPGTSIDVALRAEDVLLSREAVSGTSARNVLPGRVREVRAEHGRAEVVVSIPAPLRVSVTPVTVSEMGLVEGARVYLLIKARALHRVE